MNGFGLLWCHRFRLAHWSCHVDKLGTFGLRWDLRRMVVRIMRGDLARVRRVGGRVCRKDGLLRGRGDYLGAVPLLPLVRPVRLQSQHLWRHGATAHLVVIVRKILRWPSQSGPHLLVTGLRRLVPSLGRTVLSYNSRRHNRPLSLWRAFLVRRYSELVLLGLRLGLRLLLACVMLR